MTIHSSSKGGVMLGGNCGSMRYSAFVYEREEHISEIAHCRWLLRGCPEGSPEVDWFAVEQEFDQAIASACFLTDGSLSESRAAFNSLLDDCVTM